MCNVQRVNDNLEEFVKYFVREFEAKLHAYHLILEGEIKKTGKFSDAFSGIIGQGIGGAVGGLIDLLLATPAVGAKLGAEGGKAIGGKVGCLIGNEHHRKKVITLKDLINYVENDKANFRRKLVEDGFDIFRSYEIQFMGVSTEQGPKQAMQLLARDAADRIISYYGNGRDAENVIEALAFGSSKIESVLGVPIASSKIKNPGFTIYYGSCKEKWSTASLYGKVGLVRDGIYYEKKDGQSRVEKYGFRRLLKSENWDKLKASWNELGKTCRFEDCKYVLMSSDSENQKKMADLLDHINLSDGNLMEERVTELLEKNKNDIMEAVNTLMKQNQELVEDNKILLTLLNNLDKLNIDEYLKKFEQFFEEAKEEHKEIMKSNQEVNKRDHKITHEKLEKLLQKVSVIEKKHYGSQYFEVAVILRDLGNSCGDLGEHLKKKELLETALAIQEEHYGSNHFEVALTLRDLGNAYGDLGDHQKKKELLERTVAIQEKHYGSDHFQMALTLRDLGNAYGDLNDHQKKKKLLERAVAIQEKNYGSDHYQVALTLRDLGNAYGDLSDHQKKKELLERAVGFQEQHYGSEHFQVALTLRDLGNAYGDLSDHQKKKELLERAVAIQENHYGSDHFQMALTLRDLGDAFGDLGDYQKKKELLERALIIEAESY